MAIWGAPAPTPDAAVLAMKAAFLIQKRVEELRVSRASVDRVVFEVKIGINSVPAVVGNVGAKGRFNYTAFGATVNLAARLEKACALFGGKIAVDDMTMRATIQIETDPTYSYGTFDKLMESNVQAGEGLLKGAALIADSVAKEIASAKH